MMAEEQDTTCFMLGTAKVIVSAQDYERVTKLKWVLWAGYPYNAKVGKLHKYVIGERPSNVPITWVVDHVNRNKLDASRGNLRWVSKSFNAWNFYRTSKNTSFRGIFKVGKKWQARFLEKHLGVYETEYCAAMVYAKAAIKKWEWAATSDLLIGENRLTVNDIAVIQSEIASELGEAKSGRNLPKGVHKVSSSNPNITKPYSAIFCRRHIGVYATVEEAQAAYEAKSLEAHAQLQKEHELRPIARDDTGNAVIALAGKGGEGKFAQVPDELWHQLTFLHSWHLNSKGYAAGRWQGKFQLLHRVIYALLYSGYDESLTIDHVVAKNILDNRRCNLRLATQNMQKHNKQKKEGCSSPFIGVSYDRKNKKWKAEIQKDGKAYCLGRFASEDEARCAVNAKAKDLFGDNARVF